MLQQGSGVCEAQLGACTATACLAWIRFTGLHHVANGEARGRCGNRGRSQLLPVDLSLLPLTPLSLGLNFPIFKMEMLSGPRTSSLCGTGDTVDEVTLESRSVQRPTVSSQGHSFVAFIVNGLASEDGCRYSAPEH